MTYAGYTGIPHYNLSSWQESVSIQTLSGPILEFRVAYDFD